MINLLLSRWALIAALGLLLPMSAATTEASPTPVPALLAHGDDDSYWIATVSEAQGQGSARTLIQTRSAGAQSWTYVGRIAGRAVDLARRGDDLAVLLDSGVWMFVWPGGSSTGPRPDPASEVVQLASHHHNLWAMSRRPAATQPSATTSPVSASPRVETSERALYELRQGRWHYHVSIPDEVPFDARFAVVEPVIWLAWISPERNSIEVIHHTPGQSWSEPQSVPAPWPVARAAWLDGADRPLLWMEGQNRAVALIEAQDGRWSQPIVPAPDAGVVHAQSMAYALGSLRWLTLGDESITERALSADGQAMGAAASLPLPSNAQSTRNTFMEWLSFLAMAALTLVLIGLMRRNEDEAIASSGPRLAPAPLGLRFLAGVIDAVPLLAAMGYVVAYVHLGPDLTEEIIRDLLHPVFQLGLVVYLVLTTLTEWWFNGRSTGKLIAGLRVVRRDGHPAGIEQILIRNLLRIVDLMLLPLLLVAFSPLRQRMGDIAAGTLVVRSKDLSTPTQSTTSPADASSPEDRNGSST